jgi:hypothetical protein
MQCLANPYDRIRVCLIRPTWVSRGLDARLSFAGAGMNVVRGEPIGIG